MKKDLQCGPLSRTASSRMLQSPACSAGPKLIRDVPWLHWRGVDEIFACNGRLPPLAPTLEQPRLARAHRSSPHWSRGAGAPCRSLRLTRRPSLPRPEAARSADAHRERSRDERELKRYDKKPTGERSQGNKKEEKNKGNVKKGKKENKKGNRLCIFRNCY
jgi:hypothetical protein